MADDDDLFDDNATTNDPVADDDRPFSPPDDTKQHLPSDHPQTDTNIDSHELYDEGLDGATDVDLPGNHFV